MPHAHHKKPVTLRDIAGVVGCSPNTASLALRDSPRVSEDTRRRVRQTAEELGYILNQAARNLRSRRSGMVGLYSYALYDAVRTELVNRLLMALHTKGYRPVLGLGTNDEGPWSQSPWMQTFRELQVEALVVVSVSGAALPDWARQIPVVLVGCSPDESLNCDYLALDRTEAGALGVRHLLSRGRRNILVGAPTDSAFTQGCIAALREVGRQPLHLASQGYSSDPHAGRSLGYSCARTMPEVNGVVMGDSGLAAGFIRGVLDAGKRIPEDIAVVGYDYFPWAEMVAVPLTTIEQPISTIAALAVELANRRLNEPNLPPVHLTQPHSLVIRGSS